MGSQKLTTWLLITVAIFFGCEEDSGRKIEPIKESPAAKPVIELIMTPQFSGDNAYKFIEQQVAFGPRVPNSKAHKACAQWLESTLEGFGWKTMVQEATVTAYNNDQLAIYNIMAQWNPEAKERIMLCAHWDTRPYADRDVKERNKPIDGANDGGSGVGVLLELARIIASTEDSIALGIDIVLFDAEDYGKPETSMFGDQSASTWCLGSQYWAQNLPIAGYTAKYGILLDMVGAANAVFPREYQSLQFAPAVVDMVWDIAHALGHKNYFSNIKGNPITDDHVFVSKMAGIPTIDIIHYDMFRNDFGSFHHTHKDNMEIIDPATLSVVGEVLLQVIYQENKPI